MTLISKTFIALGILSAAAFAQDPAIPPAIGYYDSFQIDSLAFGGNVVLTNAGFHVQPPFPVTGSDICVNVYTFRPDQTIVSCCSCRVPPNNLVTVLGATGGGEVPFGATVVKIVTTLPPRPFNQCDARVSPNRALGQAGGFATGVRAWTQTFGVFENNVIKTLMAETPLADVELSKLNTQCAAVPFACSCVTGANNPANLGAPNRKP